MQSLSVKSPAKLNLFLRVVGKRRDGYHNLVTLFHRISLADTLRLTKSSTGFRLHCSHKGLPTDSRNLITRAYSLMKSQYPEIEGVDVRLSKSIPVSAGLGGGSSNAAAFLLGMNRLYCLKIPFSKLSKLGLSLGADVPFFLYNARQAIGRGVGEQIRPKGMRARYWFALLVSRQGLSTKRVFQALPAASSGASLTKVSRAVTMLSDFLVLKKFDRAARLFENDLESTAIRLKPSIGKNITKIRQLGIDSVRMTGSGPTIFAIFPDERSAKRSVKLLRRHWPSERVLICRSL